MSPHPQLLRIHCQLCGYDADRFVSVGTKFEHRCGQIPALVILDDEAAASGGADQDHA